MKVSDMTPEQREAKRKYDREQKRKQRAEKKALERAAQIPTADQAAESFAAEHPERLKELDQHVKDFAAKVSTELGRKLRNIEEEFVIDRVARCLLGLKKGWIREVTQPDGELVSGWYFADVSGDMVESANRHGLKESPTFAAMYRELLEMLDRRYGGQPTQDAVIVKAELAGTYVLPPPLEPPRPEPKPEPERLPTDAQIRAEGHRRLTERLYGDPSKGFGGNT